MATPQAGITESYQRGLRDLPREHSFESLDVQGTLPDDLRGTLYLNGPGLFSLFGWPYRHWFDGDGAITAVRLDGGQAHGAVRLVESRALGEERRAGRALYTPGATLAPKWQHRLGLRYFKNTANTKPLLWNERLFALYEAGLPTEVDPAALATVGETDLDRSIKGFFSAHFHAVPSRRALYNFSIKRGRRNVLHLFEMPAGGALHRILAVAQEFGHGARLHRDRKASGVLRSAGTDANPSRATGDQGAAGRPRSAAAGDGTTVLVVPIDAPHKTRRFEVDACFQYHFHERLRIG